MVNLSVKTKYNVGQEVYYIKNAYKKVLTCGSCNSFTDEWYKTVTKGKITSINFSGSVGKGKKFSYSYTVNNHVIDEKKLYKTKKEAEVKIGHGGEIAHY